MQQGPLYIYQMPTKSHTWLKIVDTQGPLSTAHHFCVFEDPIQLFDSTGFRVRESWLLSPTPTTHQVCDLG
jgi:hypothetical protein